MQLQSKTSRTASSAKLPGKRERAKAANREAILDAARLVFAELGYDATTVRDIIRRTELASGTFYNYFKSKEEIIEALAASSVKEIGRLLRELPREDMSFKDYLHGAFGAYFKFLADKHTDVFKLNRPQLDVPELRVDTPEMRAVYLEIRKDIETVLKSEGSPDIDVTYLTASAIGIARELGDCMLERISSDPSNPEAQVDQATQFATNLVLCGVRHAFD